MDATFKFRSLPSINLMVTFILALLFPALVMSLLATPQALAISTASFSTRQVPEQYYDPVYPVSLSIPAEFEQGGDSEPAWFASFIPPEFSRYDFSIFISFEQNNQRLSQFVDEYRSELFSSPYFQDIEVGSPIASTLGGFDSYSIIYSYTDSSHGQRMTVMDIIVKKPFGTESGFYTLTFLGPSQSIANSAETILDIASTFEFTK